MRELGLLWNKKMDAAIVIAEVKKSVQFSRACLLHAAVE
jgi:hypothetical protein